MSGRSRRWLALFGVTVLVALLRPPLPTTRPRPDRPGKFAWPWHEATKEALIGAEEELQEILRGDYELDRPSDPDRLAIMPGVTFLLRVSPDDFELTTLEWDPVTVDVTQDTALTYVVARIRVKVDGVELAGRERHTHTWIQDGDTWRLAESDVAVFTNVP